MMIHEPLHPGLIVKEILIDSTELSVTEAAHLLGVSRTTLSRLLNGHASISSEMALRLSLFFQTSIESWVNLQSQYDIWLIKKEENKCKVAPFKHAAYRLHPSDLNIFKQSN